MDKYIKLQKDLTEARERADRAGADGPEALYFGGGVTVILPNYNAARVVIAAEAAGVTATASNVRGFKAFNFSTKSEMDGRALLNWNNVFEKELTARGYAVI